MLLTANCKPFLAKSAPPPVPERGAPGKNPENYFLRGGLQEFPGILQDFLGFYFLMASEASLRKFWCFKVPKIDFIFTKIIFYSSKSRKMFSLIQHYSISG